MAMAATAARMPLAGAQGRRDGGAPHAQRL
jgi:hypothetical protein